MEDTKPVRALDCIAHRFFRFNLECVLAELRIGRDLGIWRRGGELAGGKDRRIKLRRHLIELGAFVDCGLDEFVRTIRQLLERIDSLFPGKLFLFFAEDEGNELDLPFFVRLVLALMPIKIFLDFFVGNFDLLGNVSRAQSNDRRL